MIKEKFSHARTCAILPVYHGHIPDSEPQYWSALLTASFQFSQKPTRFDLHQTFLFNALHPPRLVGVEKFNTAKSCCSEWGWEIPQTLKPQSLIKEAEIISTNYVSVFLKTKKTYLVRR